MLSLGFLRMPLNERLCFGKIRFQREGKVTLRYVTTVYAGQRVG